MVCIKPLLTLKHSTIAIQQNWKKLLITKKEHYSEILKKLKTKQLQEFM